MAAVSRLKAIFDFDGARAKTGVNKAKAQMRSLASQAKTAGRSIKTSLSNSFKNFGAGLVAGMGLGAITAGIREAISLGSKISDVAMGIGISNERLQELEYAAIIGGGSMDNVQKAFVKVGQAATQAAQGNKTYMEAFKGFGVTVDDLRTKSPDELFTQVGTAMADAPKTLKYMNDMMYLFGKQGTALLPMFALDLKDMADEAHRVGFVLGNEVVDELDAMEDKLQIIKRQATTTLGKAAIGVADGVGFMQKHVGGLGSYLGYRMGGMNQEEAAHQAYITDRAADQLKKEQQLEAEKKKRLAKERGEKMKLQAEEMQRVEQEKQAIDRRIEQARSQQQSLYESTLSETQKQKLLLEKIEKAKATVRKAAMDYRNVVMQGGVNTVAAKEAEAKKEEARTTLMQLNNELSGQKAGAPVRSDELMRMGMTRGHELQRAHDFRRQQIELLQSIAERLKHLGRLDEAWAIEARIGAL